MTRNEVFISAETRPGYIHDERQPLPVVERSLTEVDNLNRYRETNGVIDDWIRQEVLTNLEAAAKEAAMPYAVHEVEHDRVNDTYMYLGKTAVENPATGLIYHRHPAAIKRVHLEMDEGRDHEVSLRPGFTKPFISARMTRQDATLEEARAEHLGDEDAIRTTTAVTDEHGNIIKRKIQSLLVRDVPYEAWVALLKDENNLFGKSIAVNDNGSALSIMEVYQQLEVPNFVLPEGPVTLVEAVQPYIEDETARRSVSYQLKRYRSNQAEMHAEAKLIARRWLEFEVELANSLKAGQSTPEITSFINGLQSEWGEDDLAIIMERQEADAMTYMMDRQLAVVVEQAKQNLLWSEAAVMTDNDKVLDQLEPGVAAQIRRNSELIALGNRNGLEVKALEAENSRLIASQNIETGGGCNGSRQPGFRRRRGGGGWWYDKDRDSIPGSSSESGDDDRIGKISKRKCVVSSCPTRPNEVKVGGCGVCLERCQKMFDKGKDPTKLAAIRRDVGQKAVQPKPKADSHEFALKA